MSYDRYNLSGFSTLANTKQSERPYRKAPITAADMLNNAALIALPILENSRHARFLHVAMLSDVARSTSLHCVFVGNNETAATPIFVVGESSDGTLTATTGNLEGPTGGTTRWAPVVKFDVDGADRCVLAVENLGGAGAIELFTWFA